MFPEDDRKVVSDLNDVAVVDLLYRDSSCPQWIDIAVCGADKKTSLLELTCCGRYIGDPSRMYYYQTGHQPFGIKSPNLPIDWKPGMKIKLPKPNKALAKIESRRGRVNPGDRP